MVSLSPREDAVLQTVLPGLEAEGFSVFIHPSRDMLPQFLRGYQPDAVAFKGERKIAIEILAKPREDRDQLERIRGIFVDHPDWELRVLYAPRHDDGRVVPIASKSVIENHLNQIDMAYDDMGGAAAFLLAWAAFEAAARRLPINASGSGQGAGLIQLLAAEGYVTPDEADQLRAIARARNELAHGALDVAVRREDVRTLSGLTRLLLALAE